MTELGKAILWETLYSKLRRNRKSRIAFYEGVRLFFYADLKFMGLV